MGQTWDDVIVRCCRLDAQTLVAKKTTIHSHHASSGFQTRVAGPSSSRTHTHWAPTSSILLLLLKHQSKEECPIDDLIYVPKIVEFRV
jgi:hypothetical protein